MTLLVKPEWLLYGGLALVLPYVLFMPRYAEQALHEDQWARITRADRWVIRALHYGGIAGVALLVAAFVLVAVR